MWSKFGIPSPETVRPCLRYLNRAGANLYGCQLLSPHAVLRSYRGRWRTGGKSLATITPRTLKTTSSSCSPSPCNNRHVVGCSTRVTWIPSAHPGVYLISATVGTSLHNVRLTCATFASPMPGVFSLEIFKRLSRAPSTLKGGFMVGAPLFIPVCFRYRLYLGRPSVARQLRAP